VEGGKKKATSAMESFPYLCGCAGKKKALTQGRGKIQTPTKNDLSHEPEDAPDR